MTTPNVTAKREGDNLLVMEASGRIDAVTMEVALDMLVTEMEGMEHGGILMHDKGVEWPTIGAIGVELRHFGQLLAMIRKVDRAAIVTNSAVLRTAATLESALVPGLVIRCFDPHDTDGARAWLEESAAIHA